MAFDVGAFLKGRYPFSIKQYRLEAYVLLPVGFSLFTQQVGTDKNGAGYHIGLLPVVKNRARDLVRAVAGGGDVSVARIRDFARAVIETPEFQVAQETLQDASPELSVRKALQLASMVLRSWDERRARTRGGRLRPCSQRTSLRPPRAARFRG